jgi:hypothetical protein
VKATHRHMASTAPSRRAATRLGGQVRRQEPATAPPAPSRRTPTRRSASTAGVRPAAGLVEIRHRRCLPQVASAGPMLSR